MVQRVHYSVDRVVSGHKKRSRGAAGAAWVVLLMLTMLVGCSSRPEQALGDRVILFVPGVAGDGGWYDGLHAELTTIAPVRVHAWGAPKATFFLNFSNEKIHGEAETELAARIDALPPSVTRIDVVGHSAGGGVALGGVARAKRRVASVILLAPSVSPGYELTPALAHVDRIVNYHSARDVTFLKWRTGNFGTYDRVKTPAAGHAGFEASDPRLTQVPYDPAWDALGNDGDHFGPVARAFVRDVVAPTLR
jgi:pimeloyl-ACP methyl ester carboxylesterase